MAARKRAAARRGPERRRPPARAGAGKPSGAAAVAAYLAAQPPAMRRVLNGLRRQIHAAAPGLTEVVSYGIVVFRSPRMLVGLGATPTHGALYLLSARILPAYAAALRGHDLGKGTVRFAAERPLPAALVRRLVQARLAEVASRRR